ncbi:hypothetical protein ACLB2K_070303 [Fragaria x ananassa]
MANYRQAKLAVDAFRGLASRIITRPEPMSRCYYTKPSFLASTKPAKKLPGFSPSFSILHNPIPQTRLQLRSYHRDGLPLVKWLHKNSSWVFKWFSGSVTKYGTFEKVPYTNRGHLLLVSSDLERKAGELLFFEGFKYNSECRWKILPARHPESVRANVIANNIIDALKRGVNLDDKESKDSGVSHLTDLNWEVLVVDDTEYNAGCLPGGKIVVCSGLLKHYFSDAEIAMVIAHEVGHTVARHQAELVTKFLWLAFQQLVLFLHQLVPFGVLPFSSVFCFYLMVLPSWRRMEFEADHIGLILMASAGYDPRVALSMYKRLGKIYGEDSSWPDYLHSHPSMKKRKEMMAQTNIMEEALAIYRDICQSFFKSDKKYADLAGNEEMKASINAEAAGYTDVNMSFLWSMENHVTVLLEAGKPFYTVTFAYLVLRRFLPKEKIGSVKGLVVTTDGKGAVFDVAAEDLDMFLTGSQNAAGISIQVLDSLWSLQEKVARGGRFGGGDSGGGSTFGGRNDDRFGGGSV